MTSDKKITKMDYQKFFDPSKKSSKVDWVEWVYGTIERLQKGTSRSWNSAWIETYNKIGGRKASVGEKSCPMNAARTLYEFGRIKNSGLPFITGFSILQLWKHKLGGKNGTYAILTTILLRDKPHLSEDLGSLWQEIREAVKREVNYEAPQRDEGAMEVAYQLWRYGHIVDTDGS